MSKRTLFIASVIAVIVCVAGATPGASAQGPLAHGATYLDNQWHWIGPDATQWYAFEYAGDRSVVLITLTNGVSLGMQFSVYAPDRPSDQPIGRGTSSQVPCNNGSGDKCPSPDLNWKGGSSSAGTYYVKVINKTSVGKYFLIASTGVSGTIYPAPPTPVYPTYVQPYTPPPYAPPYVQPYSAPMYPYYPYAQNCYPGYAYMSGCYYYSPYYNYHPPYYNYYPRYSYPYYR